ncbi:MAG: ribonuclease Z [Muribaculum sp.]|nr:ribonuclease Z [Muribaculaceae bacterium]MCM1081394.1 ribonuclease Z [Muribaculum sp.]
MSQFCVNYLGCGSATPTLRHQPSCQVINFRDNLFMIDCGEGAQLSMRRQRLKFSRLNHIFLSHLHGDHCLGVPGLLSTLALTGRDGGQLTLHTFKEGAEMFERMMKFFCHGMTYDIRYNIINPKAPAGEVIFETDSLQVSTFPLVHTTECVGFLFREKPKQRHIIREMTDFYQVPIAQLPLLREGRDFVTADGKIVPNKVLTTDADPAYSYAYCSDTVYTPTLSEVLEGVHTIYHEATYTDEYASKSKERGHSTASQAARIALAAGAQRLVLGHYSKRYADESVHLAEASAIFPNTILSNEGLKLNF